MRSDLLQAHAESVRDSGVLGRSALMLRLFDLLVAYTTKRKTLSEGEISARVFSRNGDSHSQPDARVRVYMYRLRQRLDRYYAGRTRGERLRIPLGDYRLALSSLSRSPRGRETICPHCLSILKPARQVIRPKPL